MERGKISALQMGILMYPTILATAILTVPQIVARSASNDLWISPIWASLLGFLTVFLAYRLHALFPGETVIQYSERILGKIPGKVAGLVFLLFYLHVNGVVLREYAEFITGAFLPHTPMLVITSTLILICGFAVKGGVEVIARVGQLFFPVFVLPLAVMILVLIPEYEPHYLLPVLEHGIVPSLKGAMAPQGWFSEIFLIAFLLPFVKDGAKGGKWGMISVLLVLLTMIILNLSTLLILGTETSSVMYPVMSIAQYISIGDFFENMESVVMGIWVMGAFLKVSVFYYATTLGTAQWLNLSEYRPIVFPIGFLTLLFAYWGLPNVAELVAFLGLTAPFYLTSVQTVIPAILLATAWIRNRGASA